MEERANRKRYEYIYGSRAEFVLSRGAKGKEGERWFALRRKLMPHIRVHFGGAAERSSCAEGRGEREGRERGQEGLLIW